MARSVFYLVLILFNLKSVAQQRGLINDNGIGNTRAVFSGKVIDAKTSEPLPGASIFISDLKLGAIADASGKFSFQQIPTGHHLVEISHTGYTSVIEHIDIVDNAEKEFAFNPYRSLFV